MDSGEIHWRSPESWVRNWFVNAVAGAIDRVYTYYGTVFIRPNQPGEAQSDVATFSLEDPPDLIAAHGFLASTSDCGGDEEDAESKGGDERSDAALKATQTWDGLVANDLMNRLDDCFRPTIQLQHEAFWDGRDQDTL